MALGEPAVSPAASDVVTGGDWENPGERAEATINHAASIKQQTDNVCAVEPRGRSLKSLPTLPPGARRNTSERLLMASTCASRCQYSIQEEKKQDQESPT